MENAEERFFMRTLMYFLIEFGCSVWRRDVTSSIVDGFCRRSESLGDFIPKFYRAMFRLLVIAP